MDCCQCQGIEEKFDQEYVAKKLESLHGDGLQKSTQVLIDALAAEGVQGLTLLDIGGGAGAIQHELLGAGASNAVSFEASTAYMEIGQAEAARLGLGDRISHHQGDFVAEAGTIAPADIVTLDRVVCCYHDMPALVGRSAAKARKYYGLVYPINKWWVWLSMIFFYNTRFWLQRNPFRVFLHQTDEVEAVIRDNGLERRFYQQVGPWQVVIFARS
jgi:magnesium-protoporphyrin O-methyltransferase